MNEEQIKQLCKLVVEYGNRPFNREEKELLKQAIEQSSSLGELLLVAIASLPLGRDRG